MRSTIAILKAESQRANLELSALRDDLASSVQAKQEAERRMEEYRQKRVTQNVHAEIKAASIRWRKQVQAEVNALRTELAQQQQASMLKDKQLLKSHEEVMVLRRQLQQQQSETKALRSELGTQKTHLKQSKNRASMLLAQRTRASIAEISSLLRAVQDVKIQVSSVQNHCANLAAHVQRADAVVASLNDNEVSNIKTRQRRISDAFATIQEELAGDNTNPHDQFQLVLVNEEDTAATAFASALHAREPAEAHALDLHVSHLDTDTTAETNHTLSTDIDDTKALRKVADQLYLNLQEMTRNNQHL